MLRAVDSPYKDSKCCEHNDYKHARFDLLDDRVRFVVVVDVHLSGARTLDPEHFHQYKTQIA